MKTRFVVPAALALSFHAILLFGFRSHPGPDHGFVPRQVDPSSPTIIEWVPPPEVIDDATPEYAATKSQAPADLPEPPVSVDIPVITIPVRDPVAFSPPSSPTPLGPPGDPNGPTDIGGRRVGPVNASHLDHTPRATAQVAPIYPYEARVSGRPGDVLVEFVVDESGRVVNPHVLRSNDPAFEAPTLRAVAKWRFEPGRRNGQVVRFRMAVPVAFAVVP